MRLNYLDHTGHLHTGGAQMAAATALPFPPGPMTAAAAAALRSGPGLTVSFGGASLTSTPAPPAPDFD